MNEIDTTISVGGDCLDRRGFRRRCGRLLAGLHECSTLDAARRRLKRNVEDIFARTLKTSSGQDGYRVIRARDCRRVFWGVLEVQSDAKSGFSVAQALWDMARGRRRADLEAGFYSEIAHWLTGLDGSAPVDLIGRLDSWEGLAGREAALARSDELDRLWRVVETKMSRYPHGLQEDVQARREARRQQVLDALDGSESNWGDWRWQAAHGFTDADSLGRAVRLSRSERRNIAAARAARLPFGVTPYYASLMDETGDADRALRAQVIPSAAYVRHMGRLRGEARRACDFMREADTSPVDLVTRRYPAIAILKPYNTCPQICVYCQRNWEITQAMAPDALAEAETIDAAVAWLADHPAIREVLITGGDPMMLSDERLRALMEKLARIPHVDLIRIGTRTPVTLPMRFTEQTAAMLGSFRQTGRRDVTLVTHVEHPYEVTPELAVAIDRLRRAGVAVYNQLVYTFHVSRRFECALLRMLLRRVGVDPYYTFAPKGKEETGDFRLPLARILQERKEEVRLLPGLRRTDEPVYNLPGLGKNYLRAMQHHDLLSVLPDGSRVYEFHPWEKNIVDVPPCVGTDVPILDYLRRLEKIGEDPREYESIWYYF